jgi:hypothetical protein
MEPDSAEGGEGRVVGTRRQRAGLQSLKKRDDGVRITFQVMYWLIYAIV